ncbi:MAG: hypothetical protein O7H41_03285 [Planctomycetota bacterium]|nr:hypothetical protein [Planctomycetota bacterium]
MRPFLGRLLVLSLCSGALGAPVAAASQDRIRIDCQFGLNGLHKVGRWVPARVTVENPTDESTVLVVRLRAMTQVQWFDRIAVFSMGPHSKKTQFLYFPTPGIITGAELLWGVEGKKLRRWDVQPRPPVEAEWLVGIASEKTGAWGKRLKRAYSDKDWTGTKVVYLGYGQLPDHRIGLDGLDALYLPEAGIGLGLSQAEAIIQWVAAGGEVILSGGHSIAELSASPLLEIFPIVPEETIVRAAPFELSDFLDGEVAEGEMAMTVGRIKAGVPILESEEIPLILKRNYGQGLVTFVAFSPEALRTPEGKGISEFWARLIPSGSANQGRRIFLNGPVRQQLTLHLENFRGVQPIPLAWVVVFIIAYIVVIGPVDYFVLKRLDRLELTWITFTGAVILFSGIAYFGSVALRGRDLSVREVALVDADPETGWERTTTFLGVHSPRNIDLGFSGATSDSSVAPFMTPTASVYRNPTFTSREGDVATFIRRQTDSLEMLVRIWTPKSFEFASTRREDPFEAKGRIELGQLTLVLENPFPVPMRGMRAVTSEQVFDLGDLPAGGSREWSHLPGKPADTFLASHGSLKPTRRYGRVGPPGASLDDICLFLTFGGKGGGPGRVPSFSDTTGTGPLGTLSRINCLDRGGILIIGWLDTAPSTYVREGWEPTEEEKACLVRIALWPDA